MTSEKINAKIRRLMDIKESIMQPLLKGERNLTVSELVKLDDIRNQLEVLWKQWEEVSL